MMRSLKHPPASRGPSRDAAPPRGGGWRRDAGFTLVELSIVMAIVGIITALILVASAEGVRRAEERATRGLIAKLDLGVTDRLDALMSRGVSVNGGHRFVAAIFPPGVALPWGLPSEDRARVIARLDAIRAEMPDTFILNPDFINAIPSPNLDSYPFIFDPVAYPNPSNPSGIDDFLLPLGHMAPAYRPETYDSSTTPPTPMFTGPGDNPFGPSDAGYARWRSTATGIYGASWSARAAFNKLLGCGPKGYDGIDNDGDGLVDEWDECIADLTQDEINAIYARLLRHDPVTARSAALYALLIEGIGPGDSTFSRDDFTDLQVADTDGDGLPEFIDAWGEPIQFYRWPVFFPSPIQKGLRPYLTAFEARETSPLDPNNSLVAPAWWSSQFNISGWVGLGIDVRNTLRPPLSDDAFVVRSHFIDLITPANVPLITPDGRIVAWDRSGATPRRAYYVRPLIISAGLDRRLGVSIDQGARPIVDDVDADAVGFDDIANQTLQQQGGGIQ